MEWTWTMVLRCSDMSSVGTEEWFHSKIIKYDINVFMCLKVLKQMICWEPFIFIELKHLSSNIKYVTKGVMILGYVILFDIIQIKFS